MPAKQSNKKVILRLKRLGARGEGGLNSFYFEKKLYRRTGLYSVDRGRAQEMLATDKFEIIHPDQLAHAKREARQARGLTVNDKARQRRREAMMRKRRQPVIVEGDGILDDDSDLVEELGDAGSDGDETPEGSGEPQLDV